MQRQLGLTRQADQERAYGALATIAIGGVVGATVLEGSAEWLPPTPRYILGGLAAVAPFVTLVAGVSAPGQFERLIVRIWRLNPAYRKRQTYHESGHFLVGYLLGFEVEHYNAASADGKGASVSFLTPNSSDSDFDASAALDALLVLSLSGIAAEVLCCGDAEGGMADIAAARELMSRSSLSARSLQDDRIRWAMLMALTLLQQHRPSLDAVARSFEEGAPVGACIREAEAAAIKAT